MAEALEAFTITPTGEGYLIHIEDENGQTTEILASFDQLDLISEEIDRVLDADEETGLEAEEGDNPPLD